MRSLQRRRSTPGSHALPSDEWPPTACVGARGFFLTRVLALLPIEALARVCGFFYSQSVVAWHLLCGVLTTFALRHSAPLHPDIQEEVGRS